MRRAPLLHQGVALAVAGAAACTSCASPRVDVAGSALASVRVKVAPSTERGRAPLPLVAIDGRRTGGALLLARAGQRRLGLIADSDAHALWAVDLDDRAVHRVPLAGEPSAVVVAGDGRAYVALRDASLVSSLEVVTASPPVLRRAGELAVASEPVGLAVTPDGGALLVSSAWGKTLAAYRVADLSAQASTWLPREPRAVVVAADGRDAFISHAVGGLLSHVHLQGGSWQRAAELRVTELSLAGQDYLGPPATRAAMRTARAPLTDGIGPRGTAGGLWGTELTRSAGQGFAAAVLGDRVIMPLVLEHRAERRSSTAARRHPYPPRQPALVAVSGEGEPWLRVQRRAFAAHLPRAGYAGGAEQDRCFLPRAAAVDVRRALVLVSCIGKGEVLAYRVGRDALSHAMRGRWTVPSGPLGLAVDSVAAQLWVWSQFDRALTLLELPAAGAGADAAAGLDDAAARASAPRLSLRLPAAGSAHGAPATDARLALGRRLFHGWGGSTSGRSCASCHPDGRQDGLRWPTPCGLRPPPTLPGWLDQARARAWSHAATQLAAHLASWFARAHGRAPSEAELEALVSYLRALRKPSRAAHAVPPVDADSRVARHRGQRVPGR